MPCGRDRRSTAGKGTCHPLRREAPSLAAPRRTTAVDPGVLRLTTVIHLVRHGHVENPERVVYGRLPGFALSPLGRAQAELLRHWFAEQPLAAVISSPMERAQTTAEAIASAHGLPVHVDQRLIEASNVFEGVAGSLLWYLVRHPRRLWALRDLQRPSWGERNVDLVERMHQAVDAARSEQPDRATVLVSHQAPIWVARLAFERRPLGHVPRRRRCTLASVTSITFDGDDVLDVSYTEPAVAAPGSIRPGHANA
jgi:broad specificity phosphatase PhoE